MSQKSRDRYEFDRSISSEQDLVKIFGDAAKKKKLKSDKYSDAIQ